MMELQLEKLLHETKLVAYEAGQFLINELGKFSDEFIEQKSMNQLVSYVDKQAETLIVSGLQLVLPDAGFITEEATIATQHQSLMWVIDPLDGTTNFMHGIPVFSVSIALLKDGEPIIGVVYEPSRNEMFAAGKNLGAFLNDAPISVKQNDLLSNSLLATGFPYYDFAYLNAYIEVVKSLMKNTRGIRRMGSAAIDLAYVSCGRFDGYFEYGLSPWDVAAGILLVNEAGGKTSNFSGGNDAIFNREVIAGSEKIHQQILQLIQQEFSLS